MAFSHECVPQDLVSSIENSECVLFVGAGLSVPAGFPTWPNLLKEMLSWAIKVGKVSDEELEICGLIKNNELLDAAHILRRRMGHSEFFKFLSTTFFDRQNIPTENHKLLPSLPFSAIVTTNYDNLIDTAYTIARNCAPPVYTWRSVDALANLNAERRFYILKLHGKADEAESIILGREDFSRLLFGEGPVRQYLAALLLTKTIIFVGFSLEDPHLLYRLGELAQIFRGYMRKHYALLPNVSQLKSEILSSNFHIQTINYNPENNHIEVHRFLKIVRDVCEKLPMSVEDTLFYDMCQSRLRVQAKARPYSTADLLKTLLGRKSVESLLNKFAPMTFESVCAALTSLPENDLEKSGVFRVARTSNTGMSHRRVLSQFIPFKWGDRPDVITACELANSQEPSSGKTVITDRHLLYGVLKNEESDTIDRLQQSIGPNYQRLVDLVEKSSW